MINLPEKFEEFSDARRQGFIKAKELKEQGKKNEEAAQTQS